MYLDVPVCSMEFSFSIVDAGGSPMACTYATCKICKPNIPFHVASKIAYNLLFA